MPPPLGGFHPNILPRNPISQPAPDKNRGQQGSPEGGRLAEAREGEGQNRRTDRQTRCPGIHLSRAIIS